MNDNFLQRRCPQCGRKAVSISRDRSATRTCLVGHKWIPLKNPDPVPPEPIESEGDENGSS